MLQTFRNIYIYYIHRYILTARQNVNTSNKMMKKKPYRRSKLIIILIYTRNMWKEKGIVKLGTFKTIINKRCISLVNTMIFRHSLAGRCGIAYAILQVTTSRLCCIWGSNQTNASNRLSDQYWLTIKDPKLKWLDRWLNIKLHFLKS